jgi:hypothetical protein
VQSDYDEWCTRWIHDLKVRYKRCLERVRRTGAPDPEMFELGWGKERVRQRMCVMEICALCVPNVAVNFIDRVVLIDWLIAGFHLLIAVACRLQRESDGKPSAHLTILFLWRSAERF